MIHILATLAVSTVVTLLFGLLFGYPDIRVGYGLIPGLIAGIVFFIWRSRVVMKDLEGIMAEVQKILTPPRNINPNRPYKPRIDDAIKALRKADRWRRMHPMIAGQIDGQIGMLLYVDQRFKEAQAPLQASTPRNTVAMTMLACLYYKRGDLKAMNETFEKAVRFGKKESLTWNTWAWCLANKGDRDAAITVLNRAMKAMPGDERTERNLTSLQNGKDVRMKAWNEMWYQLHLEKPPAQMVNQAGARPRMDKRAMYRGR